MAEITKANVTLVLKCGVTREFTVEFGEPLTIEGQKEFSSMIYGENKYGFQLDKVKLPCNERIIVNIKFDEVVFSEVVFH